jgi:hypothetical protein
MGSQVLPFSDQIIKWVTISIKNKVGHDIITSKLCFSKGVEKEEKNKHYFHDINFLEIKLLDFFF